MEADHLFSINSNNKFNVVTDFSNISEDQNYINWVCIK